MLAKGKSDAGGKMEVMAQQDNNFGPNLRTERYKGVKVWVTFMACSRPLGLTLRAVLAPPRDECSSPRALPPLCVGERAWRWDEFADPRPGHSDCLSYWAADIRLPFSPTTQMRFRTLSPDASAWDHHVRGRLPRHARKLTVRTPGEGGR